MLSTTLSHCARVVLITIALLWSVGSRAQTAPQLVIPDFPLFLTSTGVPPNIVITLDDSGSMRRGYVPETLDNTQAALDGPRFKAASVNGLYYDPTKTYKIPTRTDSVVYSTSFAAAHFNGFDPTKNPKIGGISTPINLGTSYNVIAQSETDHSYSSCTNSIIQDNANTAGQCLLAKNPATTTNYSATACSVAFDRISGFDRIRVTNPTGTCSTIFSGIASGATVTIGNAGSYNGSYTVASPPAPTSNVIYINQSFDTSSTSASATISWLSTTAANTNPVPAYYYLYWADRPTLTQPASCTNVRTDDNCYIKIVVGPTSGPGNTNEQQNFANWYSFYRTRALTVMSGSMSAVATLNNAKSRLGWQTINQCTSFGKTCKGYDNVDRTNRLETVSGAKKTIFYDWVQRMKLSGSTPLRGALKRAGEYFTYSKPDNTDPYSFDPYVPGSTDPVYSCRSNYHILFTDGLWNAETSYKTPGGIDDLDSTTTAITLPDGQSYSARAPYQDISNAIVGTYPAPGNANSLADTAFYYWKTDLLANSASTTPPRLDDVPTHIVESSSNNETEYWNAKNDPATWQHMVNFTIGLGLSSSLVSNCYYDPSSLTNANRDPNNSTISGRPGCPLITDYTALKNGDKNWPRINPTIGNNLYHEPDGHVYDLWHAAINSRGKFYSADNPTDVVAAFQDVMDTISSIAAAGGGAKVSSNTTRSTEDGATLFLAKFNPDWSGTLEAVPINDDGTLNEAGTLWEAGNLIPPGNQPDGRKIFTRNGGTAQELTNCASDLQTALNKNASGTVDNLCSQRLAWLRGYTAITGASWNSVSKTATFTALAHGLKAGDYVVVSGVSSKLAGVPSTAYNSDPNAYQIVSVPDNDRFVVSLNSNPGTYDADEADNTLAQTGGDYALIDRSNDDRVRYRDFRNRPSVLGDIMNSGTVYVHKDGFGYGNASILVDGKDTYNNYVTAKASNKPVIYVGANDGMLHAFNAEITGADMGKELFAYIPAKVYQNLSALTDPTYGKSHKYFVDGTPTVSDVYLSGGWKTYLVGGLRAGGKGIYALDITNPTSFSADNVKWEFTDTGASPLGDPALGLTFGQPQIAAVSENQWAAIFGNGYNSSSQEPVLYIVDLSNGHLITAIHAPNTAPVSLPNGLSTPFLFDRNGDGIMGAGDAIYAGDLHGNLWKFEKGSSGWILGNGGAPLFTARNASGEVQAITGQPMAVLLPASYKQGEGTTATTVPIYFGSKVMVYFGTGRYLEAGDLTNDEVQTFYGVVDSSSPATVSRNDLLLQTIDSSTVTAGSRLGRTVSNISPTAFETSHNGSAPKGCYLNLPATPGKNPPIPSERITSAPFIKFFRTLEPRLILVTSTPSSDPCEGGGTSWLMQLSLNCGELTERSFDTNNDQQVNDGDVAVSGVKLQTMVGISDTLTWIKGQSGIAHIQLPGSKGKIDKVTVSDDPDVPEEPPCDPATDPNHCCDPATDPNHCLPPGVPTTPKRIYWEQVQ